jgi:hypothetical protein
VPAPVQAGSRWAVERTRPHCPARPPIDRCWPVRHHRRHEAAAPGRDGRAHPRSPRFSAGGGGCAMSLRSVSVGPPAHARQGGQSVGADAAGPAPAALVAPESGAGAPAARARAARAGGGGRP